MTLPHTGETVTTRVTCRDVRGDTHEAQVHNDTFTLDHSLAVLDQFGIDTCCGGAESLHKGAR